MYIDYKHRIFGLDCLRAIAISLVLISHCSFLLFPETTNTLLSFIRVMGAIGVDLFFVLSGYLIGGILFRMIQQDELTWYHLNLFWKRRWLRTLPNYFLILILNILLALSIGVSLPENTYLYTLFLQNFSWKHPDFFTEAWSLSVEEYAYLLLPFLLYLSLAFIKKYDKKTLFLVVTILTIMALFFLKIQYTLNTNVPDYHEWSASFRKVVIYRIDSIYIGFLLVYVKYSFEKFFYEYRKKIMLIGIFLFGILHYIIYKLEILPQDCLWFYTFVYLNIVLLSLALVFPYFVSLKKSSEFIEKLVVFISTRSYAIYLVNYSMVLLSLQFFVDFSELSILRKTALLIGFLTISITLSNVIYSYFETPILKFRDRKFPR